MLFRSDRWNVDEFYDPNVDAPGKIVTRWGGFVENIDQFDPRAFGITPREAQRLDPQQRWFLEASWRALEDAGQADSTHPRDVGVFVGAAMNHYVTWNAVVHVDVTQPVGAYQVMVGNDKDYLATRVSYKLNLVGPGLTVQTACSTSLVAVHQACQSLRAGECELDRKSTRLNSSHIPLSRMPSSA